MTIVPGGINQTVFHKIDAPKGDIRKSFIESEGNSLTPEQKEIMGSADTNIILGFGRMVEAKGILQAVKAMEHILKEDPKAAYVYIGGNVPPKNEEERHVYKSALEYAKDHRYSDRIQFLGRRDQSVINQCLNFSKAYLHAAFLEPFGLAPQEAASTGIPVVMSKEAGACDILHNNVHALHTDPTNPEDIAKQVIRVLKNQALRERLATAAMEEINRTCTWDARAHQLDNFVEEAQSQYMPLRKPRSPNGFDLTGSLRQAQGLLFMGDCRVAPENRDLLAQTKEAMHQLLVNAAAHKPVSERELSVKGLIASVLEEVSPR
jgi:glycosyltransferase involved in cell wall biosynthesis